MNYSRLYYNAANDAESEFHLQITHANISGAGEVSDLILSTIKPWKFSRRAPRAAIINQYNDLFLHQQRSPIGQIIDFV